MEQLSNIVALMLAEAVFAYENSFEIKLSDQFAMMFDMQEAEKQLMNALSEIFDNEVGTGQYALTGAQAASKWFFEQLDHHMLDYVNSLTPPQKYPCLLDGSSLSE